MSKRWLYSVAVSLPVSLALACPLAAAEVTFEAPEVILDASSYLYPSPVLHDIDKDGQRELLIGDLRGYLTVYKNQGKDASPEWGQPSKLQVNGQDLKLPYW